MISAPGRYPGAGNQRRSGAGEGEGFSDGNVLGPWIVTAEELPDPYNLAMRVRVNGEVWSEGHSGTIHWRFEQMIPHASRSETLYPGEVFRLGHRRPRLRAGARTLVEARRCGGAGS